MKKAAKTLSAKAIVKKMDPNAEETTESFEIAIVLVAAAQAGTTDADAIAPKAELPRSRVREIVRDCRRTGIFDGDKIAHSGWFDKDGGIAFWMDVAVVQGFLKRA